MKTRKLKNTILALLLIVFIILPYIGTSEYFLRILIMCFLYSILSGSLNLISGVAGQVSMGHAGFFAIGAYTSALLSMRLGWPVWGGLIFAAIVAGAAGILIGYPSLKLTGGYLAIVTLGFSEVVRLLLINLIDLTNGNIGLSGIPMPVFFGITLDTNSKYYPYALFVTLIILIMLRNIEMSKFGLNLRSIKCHEIASEMSGINVHKSKIIAFAIAATCAGVAGSLYAHLIMYIDPNVFVTDQSTMILAMVVLGGMGNLYGTVFMAFVLTILPEAMRGLQNYRLLMYGFVLVIAMLLKTVDFTENRFVVQLNSLKNRTYARLGMSDTRGDTRR